MRNILVHDYFGIDAEIVWSVVEDFLPTFESRVIAMLQEKRDGEREAPNNVT
jgi:uncharacterized protein with HEPN domain